MRGLVRAIREQRRAKKDYRALCADGRAPRLCVDIRIDPDDQEWADLDVYGMTGFKTTVPLNRAGQQYIALTVDRIRATCVRQVLHATREARGER